LRDKHPHTLTNMGSLACTYRRQGRLEDAEALQVIVDEEARGIQDANKRHDPLFGCKMGWEIEF